MVLEDDDHRRSVPVGWPGLGGDRPDGSDAANEEPDPQDDAESVFA
jgi:hypothetical protein